MGGGVPICPQDDLVLVLQDLDGPSKVACLKASLEDQRGIVLGGGDVVGKKVYSMGLGVDGLAEGRILLVVHDLIEEGVHEDDDLYILLDGLLEDVRLGLKDRVALLILRFQK